MPITVKPHLDLELEKPKMYLVSILSDSHIPWKFCMSVLTSIFHKSDEDALILTDEILTHGECFCGVYMFEIAETKAVAVEKLAEDDGFSIHCLIEEV